MLMPDELHNWLLFRDLTLEFRTGGNRPIGLSVESFSIRLSLPQAFPQDGATSYHVCKLKSLQYLFLAPTGNTVSRQVYSSPAIPPSAMDSNRVQCLRNAILTRPMGPLRCLAMMISARPCSSGSSCL